MTSEKFIIESSEQLRDLDKLKQDLKPYRSLVLYVNSLLKWERIHYPIVIFIMITGIYLTLNVMEPSSITLVSVVMIGILLLKLFKSIWLPWLLRNKMWNCKQESKYDEICLKLYTFRSSVAKTFEFIRKPASVLRTLMLCGLFLIVAWIGAVVNNFLIMYLLTIGLVMSAGMSNRNA